MFQHISYNSKKMTFIGKELKRERESRGISLKEISNTTKISLRFLRAVEEDQLDILPGKFFTRGIIRTYAKHIGLDETTVLSQYEDFFRQEEKTSKEAEHDFKLETTQKRTRKILPFALAAILLAVVLFIFYLAFLKKEKEIPAQKPPLKLPEETLAQEVTPAETPLPAEEQIQDPTELNFEISFHQETWIELYADGERKLYTLQQPGEKFQITAYKTLRFTVGNAGGFTYMINGKEGKSLGRSGAVVRNVSITLDNIKEFTQEETPS